MAFQVVYPDTDLVANLAELHTSKATFNSAGLAVQVIGNSSQMDASGVQFTTAGGTARVRGVVACHEGVQA